MPVLAPYGRFHTSNRTRQLEMVQVNVAAVVALAHLFSGMIERRRGGVAVAWLRPQVFRECPTSATYAATKAFDPLFSEALAEEVRHITVSASVPSVPGSTATEFQGGRGEPPPLHHHATEHAAKVEPSRTGGACTWPKLRHLGRCCQLSGGRRAAARPASVRDPHGRENAPAVRLTRSRSSIANKPAPSVGRLTHIHLPVAARSIHKHYFDTRRDFALFTV